MADKPNNSPHTFFDGENFRPYTIIPGSLAKHGVAVDDVRAAMRDLLTYDQVAVAPKMLLIGLDEKGRLLEMVGGIADDGVLVIWHAMKCRASYIKLLPPWFRIQ